MGIHPTPISVPPWTILGYRADGRPIYPAAGGAEPDDDVDIVVDDPEPDPADEPEPDDDPEPEPDDPPKPKPPAKNPKPGDDDYVPSAAEWRRTQAALKKANDEAKTNRLRAKELEDKGRANESDHEKALREAREDGEKKYRAPLVRTAARSALVEAGALAFLADEADPESQAAKEKGDRRLTRLLKLVDIDALDVDESGEVAGLESAVDELRRDYPEQFTAPAKKPKPRPNGANRPPAPDKPKTTAERHAQSVLGRG